MLQPSCIIITHGSVHLGMGHLVRSRNLADFLESKGRKVLFFANDLEETRRFHSNTPSVLFYKERSDREGLLPYLGGKPLIIFDCGNTTAEEVLFFQSNGCKVAAFDSLGKDSALLLDLLIDANRDTSERKKLSLLGERFIWLNQAFERLSDRKSIRKRVGKVVVSIGGYDEKGFALTLFRALFYAFYYSRHEFFEIHLKLPALGGDINAIIEEARNCHKVEVRQEGNRHEITIDDAKHLVLVTYGMITDMATLISESDVLFTSGGLTVYEGLTAGTYTLAFPQNPAEAKVVDRLLKKGYIEWEIDQDCLQEDLEYLFDLTDETLSRFLRKNREVFDGLGYRRVGEALLSLMPAIL